MITSITFSHDNQYLFTGSLKNEIMMWRIRDGRFIRKFIGSNGEIIDTDITRDDKTLLSTAKDGALRFWQVSTGRLLLTAFIGIDPSSGKGKESRTPSGLKDNTWVLVTPEGRFDTNDLEEIKGLHWLMPENPLAPLRLEIFMRDYYEPQLLPRVLSGKKFKPIRPLADLNRVQPGVKILKVEPGSILDIAKVTVEVSAAEGTFQRGGKDVVMRTGVHDLRLYRNGQLVGQWPEAGELTYKSLNTTSEDDLNAWRKATDIKLDKDGKATKTFDVRLPRREDLKEVEFTAYAFNRDRVKSETARPEKTYKVPEKLKSVPGRAYVITVGVSRTEDFQWRLRFASKDAELIQEAVGKKLKESKRYEKVVPVCLITTPPGTVDPETQAVCGELIWPTKENIKTVLDILAGRKVESARLEQIPPELRAELRRVEPEDLVLLSFSSHGVTDKDGEFYLLPYDLGKDSAGKVTLELLKRSVSSQELSLWLGPVDAEQLVMVVDACHSAGAVEVEGFKPGPMGNPGLGQLSYDKGMPILVASQASESAWAVEGYSLLSYALAREGIGEKQLGLSEALKYAEQRVPKLYEEKMGKEEKRKIQEPKLFDFKR
jgi:hypothetical protein